MVKCNMLVVGLVVTAWARMSLGGPIDSPLPNNPCLMPIDDFKVAMVANESGSDIGGPACGSGGGCAETRVVCTHVGVAADGPMDIAVELFDSAGALISGSFIDGNSAECGLQPGATIGFRTDGTLFLPYFGNPLVAGPQVPLGSLRILSTYPKKLACDVTLIDTSNIANAGTTTSIKDVTVTLASKPTKGD